MLDFLKGKSCRWLGAGILLGSYGIRILTSKDAKKVYTHGTAAVLRMKDEVMRNVELVQEGCSDILADAKEINARREKEAAPEIIETEVSGQ